MQRFFRGKKVLITGHTGFKGSWLNQVLLNWGADVVGVSLPPPTEPNLFSILKIKKNIKNYFLDIRDFEKVKIVLAKECPEIVFHLAAQPIVRDSYDDPLGTYSTNVMGTVNLLQAAKEVGCIKSVIIITTDKVYENKENLHPYKETDQLGGYDPYSASKAAADIATFSFIRSFFNIKDFKKKHNTLVAIARAGNVIGGGDWSKYRIATDIVSSIYDKGKPVIIRNPEAVRPWEHVLEALSGYCMLAKGLYEKKLGIVGAWNFGPDEESFVSVKELAERAIKVIGKGRLVIEEDISKHEANILTLDTNKAKSVLKWKPRFKFQETVAFTFSWYKNYYERGEDPIAFTNRQIKQFYERKN